MHAQKQARFFVDRVFIIRQPRAVRGSNLAEHRAALLHDLRNPKAIANLDQFSARNNHFASTRQRRQRHQHGRGAIVHHDRCFGPGKARQQLRRVHVALASHPRFQVVFQIRILRRDAAKLRHYTFRQRRTPQVRVQNHPGGVDHWQKRARKNLLHQGRDALFERRAVAGNRGDFRKDVGSHPPGDARPQVIQHRPRYLDNQIAVQTLRKLRQPRLRQ